MALKTNAPHPHYGTPRLACAPWGAYQIMQTFMQASHANGLRPLSTPDNPTVLIVDDERVVADTLAIILRGSGFNATPAYSGEAAVTIARESAPQFLVCDIFLLDGMTGIEVAIQIGALHPDCRIILISGLAASSDLLNEALTQGHEFEVLAKPFHPTVLIERLRGSARLPLKLL
jgi:CheY-like chemotaxis protein